MFLVFIYNIPVFINSEKNKRIRNIFSEILSEIILLENYENTEKIKILKKLNGSWFSIVYIMYCFLYWFKGDIYGDSLYDR